MDSTVASQDKGCRFASHPDLSVWSLLVFPSTSVGSVTCTWVKWQIVTVVHVCINVIGYLFPLSGDLSSFLHVLHANPGERESSPMTQCAGADGMDWQKDGWMDRKMDGWIDGWLIWNENTTFTLSRAFCFQQSNQSFLSFVKVMSCPNLCKIAQTVNTIDLYRYNTCQIVLWS